MLTGWQLALARFEGTFRRKQLLLKCFALGFFNGIAALRVALDPLGVAVYGHISIEKNSEARRVALYEQAGVGNFTWVPKVSSQSKGKSICVPTF